MERNEIRIEEKKDLRKTAEYQMGFKEGYSAGFKDGYDKGEDKHRRKL